MDPRSQALDALSALRALIEGLPSIPVTARPAATEAWRVHEDRLRGALPDLELSEEAEAEIELQLLGCRLQLLTLAAAVGPLDQSATTRTAQDRALNALAALALTLGAAAPDVAADGDTHSAA